MELIYLWVEKYKNIKNQGFNFSPKFECSYDRTSNNLTIEPKKYIENLFDEDGKINITAIVGENGSGKSSILNSIVNNQENDPTDTKNNILIFEENESIYYITDLTINTSITKYDEESSKLNLIIKLDRENNDNLPIDMGATPLSKSNKYPWVNYREIDISKDIIVNILAIEIGKIDSTIKLSTFMYLPNKISIKLKTPEELIGENIRFTIKDRVEIEEYFISLSDIEHQILIIEYLRKPGSKITVDIIKNKDSLSKLISLNKNFNLIELINGQEYMIDSLNEMQKNIYLRKDSYHHLLNFDLIDKEEINYNNLSHGEKVIFGQLLNIYFYSKSNQNIIFLFDEPEVALHPKWQRDYLNEVVTLLKKVDNQFHFIFTSHSPFLLSDLPKENVIFLKKGKQVDVDINPFGANIHTLLSHGFFMDGGLMGEFAKGKIDDIIKNLKDDKYIPSTQEKENMLATIKTIGEDFLKTKLLDLYYKKFDDDFIRKQRKEELEKLQIQITKELESL